VFIDIEIIGIAVGISSLSCLQADIRIVTYISYIRSVRKPPF